MWKSKKRERYEGALRIARLIEERNALRRERDALRQTCEVQHDRLRELRDMLDVAVWEKAEAERVGLRRDKQIASKDRRIERLRRSIARYRAEGAL